MPRVSIVVLHPAGRVSEMQRRQMTTAAEPNVHNVAVAGTFDDCQALVKALFADLALRDEIGLAAVNSINWARVAAQVAYYVHAALALGAPERAVSFTVPTGNFGNVYAGYAAKRMGLPVERLVVATNRNDILARFFETGRYARGAVQRTLSPSMDIQVASNFERLLADLAGRDGAEVRALMAQLAQDGAFRLTGARLRQAQASFSAARADDDACLAAIAEVWRSCRPDDRPAQRRGCPRRPEPRARLGRGAHGLPRHRACRQVPRRHRARRRHPPGAAAPPRPARGEA